jgi:hypothetical protein
VIFFTKCRSCELTSCLRQSVSGRAVGILGYPSQIFAGRSRHVRTTSGEPCLCASYLDFPKMIVHAFCLPLACGFVSSINVTDGGRGYTTVPIVTVPGGGGANAAAVAYVGGRVVIDDRRVACRDAAEPQRCHATSDPASATPAAQKTVTKLPNLKEACYAACLAAD